MLLNTCSVCRQVEKKIVAELREHGLLAVPDQPLPRGPDYADLDKLTYLTCVIKEAMRVHTVCSHSQKQQIKYCDSFTFHVTAVNKLDSSYQRSPAIN